MRWLHVWLCLITLLHRQPHAIFRGFIVKAESISHITVQCIKCCYITLIEKHLQVCFDWKTFASLFRLKNICKSVIYSSTVDGACDAALLSVPFNRPVNCIIGPVRVKPTTRTSNTTPQNQVCTAGEISIQEYSVERSKHITGSKDRYLLGQNTTCKL